MKTNKPHIVLLLALTAVFSCCSGDDYSDINTTGGNNGAPFTITVTDGGYASLSGRPSTRASEDGYKTIFTEGDKIGVFAVKGSKIVNELNNLCLTATNFPNSTWVDAKGKPLADVKGATYYAYYPYQKDLKGEFTSVSDSYTAEEFFANVISNWSPNSDQSTHAKYTAQDLMIAKGTMTPNAKSLSFSMKHQMALVVMDLPRIEYEFININPTIPNYITDVPGAIFDEFKPCRMKDGMYRYLVKPSSQDALLSGSCTNALGTTAWKVNTKNIAAGKYQIFEVGGGSSKPIKMTHELKIGDFFMKDGSLISGSTKSLTPAQQAACIGMVFKAGIGTDDNVSNYDEKLTTIHGYAVALHDAHNEAGLWGIRYIQSIPPGVSDFVNKYDGYKNTATVRSYPEYASTDVTKPQNLGQYWAFKVASEYNVTVPQKTSGWYMPSVGQFYDIDHIPQRSKLFDIVKGDDLKQPIYWVATEKNSLDVWMYEPNKGPGKWPKKDGWQGNNCYAYVRSILTF